MAPDIVPISVLTPAERDAAIAELAAACEAISRVDLAPLLATKLGKDPGGFVIEVRVARHAKHYKELTTDYERLAIDANRSAYFESREQDDDARWLEVDREWRPIVPGVALLASPESPELELERRHAIVDARRAEKRKRDDAIAEAQRKREAERAEWQAKNGAREKRFYALPREYQLLYAVADRLPPSIRSVVVMFATEYARVSEEYGGRRLPPLPASFPANPEDERGRLNETWPAV